MERRKIYEGCSPRETMGAGLELKVCDEM
jgi:hypothetical protein